MDNWQDILLVGGAIKAGIFQALADSARTVDELSTELELDERALKVVLDALTQASYLSHIKDRYTLEGANHARFGDENHADYEGHLYRHNVRLIERWLTLAEVLKTGSCMAEDDRFTEGRENFIRAMDYYTRPVADAVATECLRLAPGASSVLDVGGGWGTFSQAFAKKGLDVTLFDLPEVIEIVGERALPANIKLAAGDFNEEVPKGPFDIVFLGNVTHIYGPEHNRLLYTRLGAEIASGGSLLILDFLRKPGNTAAAYFGINMLANTMSGGTWTEQQYSSWLGRAGFEGLSILDIVGEAKDRKQQLIHARRSPVSSRIGGDVTHV